MMDVGDIGRCIVMGMRRRMGGRRFMRGRSVVMFIVICRWRFFVIGY